MVTLCFFFFGLIEFLSYVLNVLIFCGNIILVFCNDRSVWLDHHFHFVIRAFLELQRSDSNFVEKVMEYCTSTVRVQKNKMKQSEPHRPRARRAPIGMPVRLSIGGVCRHFVSLSVHQGVWIRHMALSFKFNTT